MADSRQNIAAGARTLQLETKNASLEMEVKQLRESVRIAQQQASALARGAVASPSSGVPLFGGIGASSKWDATGASFRAAQAKAEVSDSFSDLGASAVKVAAGFATVTMAAQAVASALAAAASTRAEAGRTKEGQIFSVAETSALLGSSAKQEQALAKMLDMPGAYTREQKAGLVESFGSSLAANPAARVINKPEDLMNVLSALESGQIGLKQAQDIVSGTAPLSVGLAVQTTIAPRRPLSAQGNKALRNTTEMRRIAESAAGGIVTGETPEQRATREYEENLQALREEGTFGASFTADRVGSGIIGGITRGLVESKSIWAQTSTGNLSPETLLKAESTIQRRQLMELEKMNMRAVSLPPSPIEGR